MGIEEIPRLFRTEGSPASVIPYGSGHIHRTYRVVNNNPEAPDYLLQQINEEAFRDVPGMMENISLVTRHVAAKAGPGKFRSLELVRAQDGNTWLRQEGKAWRMYVFLDGLVSFDQLPDLSYVEECGRGFGQFARLVADLPASELTVTIPRFHDIAWRLEQLETAADAVESEREESLLNLVKELEPAMVALDQRDVPLRITHNDTKCNNLLFDKTGRAVCVVDLDTVMPGKVWYDTGDSLRSVLTNLPEDAAVSDGIRIHTERYHSFLQGYLGQMAGTLTTSEQACIPRSGAYMAFIMGVRFLTDHLKGDIYYTVGFRGHNLKRAVNQLTLARELYRREEVFEEILGKVLENMR